MSEPEGLSELEKAMRRRPSTLAAAVMEDLAEQLSIDGEVEPPVDLSLLASLQSIGQIARTTSKHAGCLIRQRGQLRIEVSATDCPGRQNFTIGHEICHTLLPGFTLTKNFRCNPGRPKSAVAGQLDVEALADIGASELLLPRRFVRDDFASRPFGWDSITEIADLYGASLEATARRFVHLATAPSIFARLEFLTSNTNPIPELRVSSASWSNHLATYIPKKKSVPHSHPIFRSACGEYIDQITDLEFLTRHSDTYHISARPSPYTNTEGETVMRVLVLAHSHVTSES